MSLAYECSPAQALKFPAEEAKTAVARALAEDAAEDDITTLWSVRSHVTASASLVCKERGMVAGLPAAAEVVRQVDAKLAVVQNVAEGARVDVGDTLLSLRGNARSIITAERTLLNFVQRMSGIATATDVFVASAGRRGTAVFDTRKTAPGLRALDKYAVSVGGGRSHRMDLSMAVILKENHIAMSGGVTAALDAVHAARQADERDVKVVVEVQSLEEAREALDAKAQWIMLDNMSAAQIARVVELRNAHFDHSIVLEASGNITLKTVELIAAAGVDVVSVGALTNSQRALDLSLLLDPSSL